MNLNATMFPAAGLRPVFSNSARNRAFQNLRARHNKYSTVISPISVPRSSPRAHPLLTRTRASAIPSIPAICAGRFYSSETTQPISSGVSSAPAGAADSALPTFEELTNSAVLLNIPERIGFLKELGLDFGWGPTAVMENVLEHVHIWSGMPWYGSIIGTALLMRVVLFPLYLKMSDQVAKQRALSSVTAPLREKQINALKKGNTAEMQAAAMELRNVYYRAGIKTDASVFLPPLAQGVLGFGMWRLLRTMGNLPVPGLLDGGWAWFIDLSLPDPYYVLPLCTAGVLHMVGRMGGEAGVMALGSWQRGMLLYGLPSMSFLFTFWLPATVQVYFAATAILSQAQSLILRTPWVRRQLNLTPLYSEVEIAGQKKRDASYGYQAPKTLDTTLTSENSEENKFSWTKPSMWWGSVRGYARKTFTKNPDETTVEQPSIQPGIEYEKRRQKEIAVNSKRTKDRKRRT